jgi:hypothetical protein
MQEAVQMFLRNLVDKSQRTAQTESQGNLATSKVIFDIVFRYIGKAQAGYRD